VDLTPELVALVHRFEADEGPRPEREQMNDGDYAELVAQLLENHGDGPLRIFAYGSLIWKPEFDFAAQQQGVLKGWHRSFCMHIERWRGTRTLPGLMMALDEGGQCEGVIFELPLGDKPAQLDRLLRREMTNKPPTNMPRWMDIEVDGGIVSALAFTTTRLDHSYRGNLPLPEVAAIVARAAGHWGSGAEYLFNTVSNLEQLKIRDENLWELQRLVAAEILALKK
jgi:glutathione-specific gamma-glutamylcyclotransferase